MPASKRPRHGSLGFYHNSRRTNQIPSVKERDVAYYRKIGMITYEINSANYPCTVLQPISESFDETHITIRRGKKLVFRETNGLSRPLSCGDRVITIGYTKPQGFVGPIKRWGAKLGMRKNIGAGTRRNAGPLGCREPAITSWRRLFGGRDGGNRRTYYNNRVIGIENDCILLRGSTPGRKGGVIALRHGK